MGRHGLMRVGAGEKKLGIGRRRVMILLRVRAGVGEGFFRVTGGSGVRLKYQKIFWVGGVV